MNAEPDREVTLADFSVLMEGLGQSLASAYEETRNRLRQRVLSANDPLVSELRHTQQFQNLELASFVLRCGTCRTASFGWDDVWSHCCKDEHEGLCLRVWRTWHVPYNVIDEMREYNVEFPYTFEYWECGSVAVREVIKSLGMDPRTTTTAQLDAEPDLRLECLCSSWPWRRCAYKWRILVCLLIPLLSY